MALVFNNDDLTSNADVYFSMGSPTNSKKYDYLKWLISKHRSLEIDVSIRQINETFSEVRAVGTNVLVRSSIEQFLHFCQSNGLEAYREPTMNSYIIKPEINHIKSGTCKHCGCTDDDCSSCIKRTGEPCHWVDDEHTVCSACVDKK